MDPSSGLRALNLRCSPIALLSVRRRSRPLGRPGPLLSDLTTANTRNRKENNNYKTPSLLRAASSSSSALERGDADYCSNGIAGAVSDVASEKLLQVVLVSPQIPGNTGCIARTCAASAVGLHLVEPLGYKIDDTKLKRAGLDYWPYPITEAARLQNDPCCFSTT